MSKDQNELLLLGSLSPGVDRAFLERLQGCVNYRNAHGATPTPALQHEDGDRFKQMVVGPNHIAFLTKDHQIMRLKFDVAEVKLPPTTSTAEKAAPQPPPAAASAAAAQNGDAPQAQNNAAPAAGNGGIAGAVAAAAAASGNNANAVSQFNTAANRNAKMRRVMMATRRAGGASGGFQRSGGVIIDRTRALIPAANIPEDLIAQAQVVLQGKSREVIVRELQRTNLNVNEAVNNLLSREDDDEEFEEATDAYLPEELLSLLDADSSLMARFAVRRRENRERPRERVVVETSSNAREMFEFADKLEYWTGDEKLFPPNITAFEKIGAMNGELIALANNGLLYSWKWTNEKGDDVPHHVNATYLGHIDPANQKDRIVDIETCAYRCAVLTSTNKIGSFADEVTVGKRVADAMFQELVDFPDNEVPESLHVCPTFTAIKTKTALHWWGIMPFVERRRVFEKTRNKAKKFTSNSSCDIKVGAEVRTKSNPVYAANSIAVNLHTGGPTIGVMMESAWSINETCRFRTYTPAQFDILKDEVLIKDDKRAINLSVRKRAAPSDEPHPGSSTAAVPHKETAWPIKEVFFIHEEPCNDTGIVQIVDGQICGIHFKTYIDEKSKSGDGSEDLKRLRLMRKEELIVVQSGTRQPTAPITFERTLQRVLLPVGIRRIISTVIDNSGFRLLVEKKGRLHLLRLTTLGKIASDHVLPMSCSAVCGPPDAKDVPSAKLINYGDPDILVLQDYNGCLIPLIRDATTGYCAPPYIGFTGMKNLALGVQYLKPGMNQSSPMISSVSAPVEKVVHPDTPRSGSKVLFVASIFSGAPESTEPLLPSLTQLALYCDVDSVKVALSTLESLKEKLSEEDFAAFIQKHVVDVRADGNRNLLHAAVMNAFAKTNADQNKVDAPAQNGSTPNVSPSKADSNSSSVDKSESEAMEVDVVTKPVSDPVQRQKNAVAIIQLITESKALRDVLPELLHQRDVNGHTPFISAIQNRAYAAAIAIWNQMRALYGELSRDEFTAKVYNPLQHYDDSPLFILAYNDTCSFTWTGDEHINQDIFECRTCGLTGSLCCCTECAQTCHRNHDCKLKRTSPTAYCDCWERCPCKALVAGNDDQREFLMIQLLDHTNLIQRPNSRGEHLLLFLVKTVGRQLIEQENYRRRTTRSGGGNANANAHAEIPERDLEPPKFAQRALAFCLIRWEAVKSLIAVGMKKNTLPTKFSDETFHLSGQNGSTHLDKFVFILLSKCHQAHLDSLLHTLIVAINEANNGEHESNDYASRFLRSVIRMFAIITLANPNTISQTVNSVNAFEEDGYDPKFTNADDYRPKRESAMVSIVRSMPAIFTERAIKDTRPYHTEMFVAKCRRAMQALAPHAIVELLNAADAYLAPVRNGFVNPTVNVAAAMGSHDPLEYIERHLMSEQDLSSFLDPANEMKSLRRRRYGSRHNAEDEAAAEAPPARAPAAQADSENSDSDSETEPVSRRFSSQGSLHGQALESLNNVVRNYRRNTSVRHVNSSNNEDGLAALAAAAARARQLSTSSEDSSDDSNDDESETERVFGNLEDFENNEFDDDEEVREEEGDEYYDEEEGEEAPNDFAEDDEASGNDEDDYDDDASPAAADENAQPPVDEPMDAEGGEVAVEVAPPAENAAPEPPAPMEVYIPVEPQDAVNAMIEQANEEVAIDIVPGEEAADVSVQPGNDVFAAFRPENVARRPPPPASSSRSLTWAVPTLRGGDTDSAANGELVIRTSIPPSSVDTTSRATSKSENPDDSFASNEKTAQQFAAVFAAFIRSIDDVLLYLSKYHLYAEKGQHGFPTVLELDYQAILALRKFVDLHLTVHWHWLCTVMDKVEAQLKFGTALHSSPASAYLNIEPEKPSEPKKDEKRKYVPKKSGESSSSSGQKKEQHQNRRDFLQYFFSISRSHAHENGDELPIIEYRALRAAALVAEAFLFHAAIVEVFHGNIETSPGGLANAAEEAKLNASRSSDSSRSTESSGSLEPFFVYGRELDRFFKRPPALCYPTITYAQYHNAFSYSAEECLPLACRSQMLLPDVEKSQLFGMPIPHRTHTEHLRINAEHGVADPTFQSLGQYPSTVAEVYTGPKDRAVKQVAPPSVNHPTYQIDYSVTDVHHAHYNVDDAFAEPNTVSRLALHRVLSRWSNTFSLITQMYTDDLVTYSGGDAANSVTLVETASFHFRQSQFRKRVEKIKTPHVKDLAFSGMLRDKSALITQTFRTLNQAYSRRLAGGNTSNNGMGQHMRFIGHREILNEPPPPPLASHKVKVTFKDEPGEGTGVARSFYSAVADALATLQNMPLEGFEYFEENDKRSRLSSSSTTVVVLPAKRLTRQTLQTMTNAIPSAKRSAFKKAKHVYNLKAALYSPTADFNKNKRDLMPAIERSENPGKEKLGDVVFALVHAYETSFAQRTSGILLDLADETLLEAIKNPDILHLHVIEIIKQLQADGYVNSFDKESTNPLQREDAPFFSRLTNGHFVPLIGTGSFNRINGFRNIGRMIGLCLQQREIFPLQLARHVLQFTLGQPLTWYDCAFFDPVIFDSVRALVYNEEINHAQGDTFYESLCLTFMASSTEKEGARFLELVKGGENISVDRENILEYVYHYVHARLHGPNLPALEAIRTGVFDVIPPEVLNGLTPEDLRLLLCGSQDINMTQLESYTKFLDESSSASDVLEKYKQTFWSVVNKFTSLEKQDLIFFWTGSPTLPANEEEFTPLPTIMIRPSDQNLHLPTANTCISRLYLPLYSSKKILRSKLLLAIKSRNFGFV
uniref:E3 ubiquitin-protein ligase UBR5 n=1 Tax=Panagrellus redivivus TaxID=6233 RepID=A0A7E4ZWY5_PANRE